MPSLILTSFASKADALRFSKSLVSQKLAACCTLIPSAVSVFEWKGKQQIANEVLLLIKTLPAQSKKLEKFFKDNHPYELPEFLEIKAAASQKFASWMAVQVK